MFYVEPKPGNNNKDTYEVRHLLDYSVEFEPSHSKREILQCIVSAMTIQKTSATEKRDVSSVRETIQFPT